MSTTIKRIAILGSTGSIGKQALEIVQANPDRLQVEVLTAQHNADLLIEQAIAFEPNAVVIGEEKYKYVKEALTKHDIKVFTGADSLCQVVQMESVDMVLASIVGFAGSRAPLRVSERHAVAAAVDVAELVQHRRWTGISGVDVHP